MIIDARTLAEGTTLESTVCIAGAGAAGLTLAYHLAKKRIPVCVIESGDLEFDSATQDLACGQSVGLPYEPGSTRYRFFGGSTNGWGALLRPISDHCFGRRDWVANTEWPIQRKQLNPYYERAFSFLEVTGDQLDGDKRLQRIGSSGREQLVIENGSLETRISALARPSIFKDKVRPGLREDAGAQLLLNANVVRVDTSATPETVKTLTLKTLCGKTLSCRAKIFILCMGGIENARVLLLSNEHQNDGLGNSHDLVGRYFMDHPRFICGRLYPSGKSHGFEHYNPTFRFSEMPSIASLSISAAMQEKEELLDNRFYFIPVYRGQGHPGFEELVWLKWKMRATRSLYLKGTDFRKILRGTPSIALAAAGHKLRSERLLKHYAIVHTLESAPDRNSRVTLGTHRDALGCNCVSVDWRLGEIEKRTIFKTQEILTDILQSRKIGTVETEESVPGSDALPAKSSWHHMGTTRMSANPRHGVVDADCRLHGTRNLYVAGSSVFPTCGDDVPTLTIVALAIRLADHLEARLT